MFGLVHSAGPVRVQVGRNTPDAGLLGVVLAGAGRAVSLVGLFCWRAPLVASCALMAVASTWMVARGYLVLVVASLAPLVIVGAVLAWRRPGRLRSLGSCFVGQVLRAFVYRPRWETACEAARVTVRVRSLVHVPVLVRHRHSRGADALLVRMAPGQTVADWQAACPSLASTFTAHSVTAVGLDRPGWVRLDVLRRDPLGRESASGDPARALSGPVVLGRDEHGAPVGVDPYRTAHIALQGATRSGKSSACYTLLGALAHRTDVVVCGVDPSGLLLGAFETGRGAGHIATGTRAEDLDHAADVLTGLLRLMDERVDSLRRSGADKLATFSAGMPAVWVVLEEYPGLLSAARALDAERGAKPGQRLATRLERAVGRLVKEGAKVGVCVLVIAQRMSADALDTDDRSNIALRVTLRVDNGDAVRMLHDGITTTGIETVRQFAPGVALMESPGRPVRRVRFHHTDYATYRARVAAGIATAPAGGLTSADVLPGLVVASSTDGQVAA